MLSTLPHLVHTLMNMPTLSGIHEFSDSLWEQIDKKLHEALATHQGPRIAAFDADGTLWDTDIGEAFFDYQIAHCRLQHLPKDPWTYYRETKAHEPTKAYLWLAQISEGHTLTDVQNWAKASVAQLAPLPIFKSQQRLIALLRALSFEIYVVTASVKWAVEPAATLLGIDADHVLGITTQVVNGVVTGIGNSPITWREGKAQALLSATGGVHPLLASGNTYGDIALIETSRAVKLAVSTQIAANHLRDEEHKLHIHATQMGWLQHRFRG
jgi:phosphoserine phosphatase